MKNEQNELYCIKYSQNFECEMGYAHRTNCILINLTKDDALIRNKTLKGKIRKQKYEI
jgi:hypothetical protein